MPATERRRFSFVAALLAGVLASALAGSRPRADAAPSVSCDDPDVAPRVLRGTPPAAPPALLAAHQQAVVEVRIDLDEQSRLDKASIYRSSNPAFNDAALEAAKSSEYRTQIHDCRPVAASYRLVYNFDAVPYDPIEYYSGRWRCTSASGDLAVSFASPQADRLVRHVISAPPGLVEGDETFDFVSGSTWTLGAVYGGVPLNARSERPPTSSWLFSGAVERGRTPAARITVDYERATDDRFMRVYSGIDRSSQVENCTREKKSS